MPVPLLVKAILIIVLIYINFAPIFAQFFNGGLPILSWVILFFNSKNIPLSMKRPISVKVLPALETIFYGDNLSEILASHTNTFLDLFAWFPYGIVHFSLPSVVAALIFLFAPPKTLPQFCWSFGYMNLVGVIIQNLVFSCAPPWYKVLHGLDKANYSMKGSPGGLGRIDGLFGFDMYTSGFTNSPLIFGAMPSLHSGCSTMDALWLSYLFPKFTPLFVFYVCWLWFSTMYLTHHYFIDVVVGSCLAIGFFTAVKWRGRLPVNDLFCRWDHDTLKFHDIWNEDPLRENYPLDLESSKDLENQIPLSDLNSSCDEQPSSPKGFNRNQNNNLGDKGQGLEQVDDQGEEYDNYDFDDSDDDQIAEANDVEKSANKTIKKTPKSYKESFEATLSTNLNSQITNFPSSTHIPLNSSR